MRIGYVCSDPGVPLGGRKGASVHVEEMARAFADLGHEVLVVARRAHDGGLAPHPRLTGAVPPTSASDRELADRLRNDPEATPEIAWTVAAITGAATFRLGARDLLRDYRPDLIYERYALFGSTGGDLADELGVPHVLEVNAPLTDEQASHRSLAFAETAHAVERAILARPEVVVAVSRELERWLHGLGVDPGRTLVLGNGVDTERFRAAGDAVARRDGQAVVGFVGTLKPWHDVASVIGAVAALRRSGVPVRLRIVGDGPQRPSLQALATALDMQAVIEFTGAVDHDAVPDLLGSIDVAVAPYAPSDRFYFSPLKLFEYLAAGRPVVAPAMGDMDECVTEAGAGWSYRADDPDGLRSALQLALADPAEAARRGALGRAHVEACHTWRHNAERVLQRVAGSVPAGVP